MQGIQLGWSELEFSICRQGSNHNYGEQCGLGGGWNFSCIQFFVAFYGCAFFFLVNISFFWIVFPLRKYFGRQAELVIPGLSLCMHVCVILNAFCLTSIGDYNDFLTRFELVMIDLFCMKWIRFEEKLSNIESENQVLRQQALAISPTGRALSTRQKTTILQV